MPELVFLLEEESAKAMLEGLLPRLLPYNMQTRYIVFDGKSDLEKQLVKRLQNYLKPNAKFIILRDQDAADCKKIKAQLVEKCREAQKTDALVRIACHELESWYLGDLKAVETALGLTGLAKQQNRSKYRSPDKLANAATELSKLSQGRYQKVGGSRLIGQLLDIQNTRSNSFKVFITGVKKIANG